MLILPGTALGTWSAFINKTDTVSDILELNENEKKSCVKDFFKTPKCLFV